jgi:hypothetical protein
LRFRDVALHALIAVFVLSPLAPQTILGSYNDDLANHVRFVYEASQALREGQFPPQTTVGLHDGVRLPLFQFYSGSAYVLPGALGLIVDPYSALRLTCLLLSLLAALALRAALEGLGAGTFGALVGAAALQLAPFGVVDLQHRGAYPEWAALQLGVICLAELVQVLLAQRARGLHFAAAAIAGAAFIAAHPLQTLALGAPIGVLLAAAWRDARARWADLVRVAAAGATAVALSAYYWLPIAANWSSQKMPTRRGVFDSAGVQLADVFWPWARGGQGLALQLGAPLAIGFLLPLLLRRRPQGWLHAGAMAFGLGAAVLAGSADAINLHWPALAGLLRHYQTAFRFLVPATACGAVALGLACARLRPGPWPTAAVLLAIAAHAAGYVFPSPGAGYTHTLATVADPSFRVPNASFYAFVGTDFARLGWTDSRGDLLQGQPLPLPRAGLPFAARLTTDVGQDLQVRVGLAAVPVATLSEGAFAFDVRPARQFFIHFQSAAPRVRVRSIEVLPDGDREWIALPLVVQRDSSARRAWRATVVTARAGLAQLPVAHRPWDRAFVGDRPAEHASRDRFLWVLRLPAGESAVRVEARAFAPGALLALAGLLATVCGAWCLRDRFARSKD